MTWKKSLYFTTHFDLLFTFCTVIRMPRRSSYRKSVRNQGGKSWRRRQSRGSTRTKLSLLSKRHIRSVKSGRRRTSRNVRDVKKGGASKTSGLDAEHKIQVGSIVSVWLQRGTTPEYHDWYTAKVEDIQKKSSSLTWGRKTTLLYLIVITMVHQAIGHTLLQ